MFSRDIIDELPKEIKINVKLALTILYNSPLFELQEQLLLATLAHGSESEDELVSLKRLQKYRSDRAHLLSLKQLGEEFNEERNDEQP